MVTLSKITTKNGDEGMTSLGDGTRVSKDSARIEALGAVDELNSLIGLARAEGVEALARDKVARPRVYADLDRLKVRLEHLDDELAHIQNDLFDLGADLCVPTKGFGAGEAERPALRMGEAQIEWLERTIGNVNAPLPPLRSFVIPGGSRLVATLHVARTAARRAERTVVTLTSKKNESVGARARIYLNRLSDYLFVAARSATEEEEPALWEPGRNA